MIKDVVLCGDCKYKPYKKKYLIKMGDYEFVGETIESSPFSTCPCIAGDERYSWIPADDWYCKNGVPK